LPVSLILIFICILTLFTINWSSILELNQLPDNNNNNNNNASITNDILLSTTNFSFAQNHINQVDESIVFSIRINVCFF